MKRRYHLKNLYGVVIRVGEVDSLDEFFNEFCRRISEFDYIIVDSNSEIVGVIKGFCLVWRMEEE